MNILGRHLAFLCEVLGSESPAALDPSSLSDDDWTAAIGLANSHLLGPALYKGLRRRGWFDAAPQDARAYLMMLYRMNARRNLALRRQAEEVLLGFNAAGMAPILLKGGATLLEPSDGRENWSWRMMRDLDVLVPRASAIPATAALTALGYDILTKYPDDHHAVGEFGRSTDPGAVDLHTQLVDPWYILPADEICREAAPRTWRGLQVSTLSPNHRIMHHVLHAQVHHLGQFYLGEVRLNQLYEFVVLVRRSAGSIDWRYVRRRLGEYHLSTPLHSYLIAAHRLFGLPWPLEVAPSLAGRMHFARCLLHLRYPKLNNASVLWGNLRGALAIHRIRARYGHNGLVAFWQAYHAWRYWKNNTADRIIVRLFRVE